MILVTSANGQVGRRIIPELAKRGLDVRAMDINPGVEELKELGAKETFVGDASKAEVMREAMMGCDKVLYIPPMFVYNELKMAKLAIDIAVEQHVKKYVFMSVLHPQMSTLLQHTHKLHGEEYLIYKGLSDNLDYTILQPMHYHHTFRVADAWNTNCSFMFYDLNARLSGVDARDVAEVAAKVLTEPGHENATYELCGPDFISAAETVEIFNKVTGKDVQLIQIDVEELLKRNGLTDSYGKEAFRALAYTYGTYGFRGNPNVLTWLLGRAPITFEEWLKDELEALHLS